MKRFCSSLVTKFQRQIKKSKWILEDDVSVTHGNFLYKTLNGVRNADTNENNLFKVSDNKLLLPNDVLPYGYHFAYFNPMNLEQDLGDDGYDNHQAPYDTKSCLDGLKSLYKRRMWVGGQLLFNNENPLRFQEFANCIETVQRVKNVGNSCLVTIDRKIFNGTDFSIHELRTLFYTNETYIKKEDQDQELRSQANVASDNAQSLVDSNNGSLPLKFTKELLFRYSALTFNAHKIHYDTQYAQKVENYPEVLVQGPLLVTLMLQFVSQKLPKNIVTFSYRNRLPIFVNTQCILKYRESNENELRVWIENEVGETCVEGKIQIEEVF